MGRRSAGFTPKRLVDRITDSSHYVSLDPFNALQPGSSITFLIQNSHTAYDLSTFRLDIKVRLENTDGSPVVTSTSTRKRSHAPRRLFVGHRRMEGAEILKAKPRTATDPADDENQENDEDEDQQQDEAQQEKPPPMPIFINNLAHSMFQAIDVELNSVKISTTSAMYFHIFEMYLKQILTGKSYEYNGRHMSEMFYMDRMWGRDPDWVNLLIDSRSNRFEATGEITMSARVPHSLFFTDKQQILLPGQTIKIILYPTDNEFLFYNKTDAKKYQLRIVDIKLRGLAITYKPAVLEEYMKRLQAGPVYYPMDNIVKLNIKQLQAGQSSFAFTHYIASPDDYPKSIVYGFIKSERFYGRGGFGPFIFMDPPDLENTSLFFDSVPVGGRCMQYNGDVDAGYERFTSEMGLDTVDTCYTWDAYHGGVQLHGHSLKNLRREDAIPEGRSGLVQLDVKFSTPLAENQTLLVFFIYDKTLAVYNNQTKVAIM